MWGGRGVVWGGVCALVTVKHLSPWVFQLQLTNHITVICLEGGRKVYTNVAHYLYGSESRKVEEARISHWQTPLPVSLYSWFFVLLNAVLKKRKAHEASERWRRKGACIRGAIAPNVEKTKKKYCKISNQHRQASAKSIVCECLKKKLYDILEQINEPLCDCFLICTMQIIPTLKGYC